MPTLPTPTTAHKLSCNEALVESLDKCLGKGWLSTGALIEILEQAELAGRQHICLFEVKEDDLDVVRQSLSSPRTLNEDLVSLEEFFHTPLEPYSRILESNKSKLLKIVATRDFWEKKKEVISADEYVLKHIRHKERSAVIVKLDPESRILQFRVPIRDQNQGYDTTKTVYEFIELLVAEEFGDQGVKWFLGLNHWPIGDSFNNIFSNHDDFKLHADAPENNKFKGQLSKKGQPDDETDLRQMDEWNYSTGYARTSIQGIWKIEPSGIDVHMHDDSVKLSPHEKRNLARIFFPKSCLDQEVEHVISRIRDHIPPRRRASSAAIS